MDATTPQDELCDLALSWRNDPALLLKFMDELANWLRTATAGDVWQPGPFPEFGRVIRGKLLQPDILIRLRALKCLAAFRNDDGLSATIDLELIDDIMRGYTDAVMNAERYSERLTETQSLQRRAQEMRLEIRIWGASKIEQKPVGEFVDGWTAYGLLGIKYMRVGSKSVIERLQKSSKAGQLDKVDLSTGQTELFELLLNAPNHQCGDEQLKGKTGSSARDSRRKMLEGLVNRLNSIGLNIDDTRLVKLKI